MALMSALALLAAFIMQYGFGLAPCTMCIWQRYPYAVIAVLVPAVGFFISWRIALMAALLLLLTESGLAFYHWAIELKLVPLPSTCGAIGPADSFEAFKASILADKPKCDEVAGTFLGLSIAAWNALLASGLTALVAFSLLRQPNPLTAQENVS